MKSLHDFDGGIVLEGHKLYGEAGRTRPAPIPSELILSLDQHIGAPARPLVHVGQHVLRGEVIAEADGAISAALHASTSGEIVAIEDRPTPHPSGLPVRCIVLRADGSDDSLTVRSSRGLSDAELSELELNTLIQLCRDAGVVGLGGAAFPAGAKLHAAKARPIDTLIVNGAECEPYISCDGVAMLEDSEAILHGAALLQRVLGAKRAVIAVEDENREALRTLRESATPLALDDLHVCAVPTRYPQGGEKQLVQTLTGREVPSGAHPTDVGIVVHNVATVAAIWKAATQAIPLTERIVTVTGPGIRHPANLRVRIGTPVRDLIAACGGYATSERHPLLMGGPMMGFALPNDSVPVVKATNCILVDAALTVRPTDNAMPCIRCGDCVAVCPSRLLPQQLYWHARAGEFDKTAALNLSDCIECGCCAEVCPSQIPLVSYYRYAKSELRQQAQEKQRAEVARARFDFRAERLERERTAKEEARRRKREELAQKQAAAKAAAEQEAHPRVPEAVTSTASNPAEPVAETPANNKLSPAVRAALEKARRQQAAQTPDALRSKTGGDA